MPTHEDLEDLVRSQKLLIEQLLGRSSSTPPRIVPMSPSPRVAAGGDDSVVVTPFLTLSRPRSPWDHASSPLPPRSPSPFDIPSPSPATPPTTTSNIHQDYQLTSPSPRPPALDPISAALRRSQNEDDQDSLVHFFVEGRIFTVCDRPFCAASVQARDLLARTRERSDGVVVIEDMSAFDFTRFLEVVRCNIADGIFFTGQIEWISVLRVAHRFGFAAIRALAIEQLAPITTAVDRIVLAREFGVREWLKPAYVEVCTSAALLEDEDADRLGFELFKKIVRVRHGISTLAAGPNEEVENTIEDVFQLRLPEPPVSVLGTPAEQSLGHDVLPFPEAESDGLSVTPADQLAPAVDNWFGRSKAGGKKKKGKK